MTGLQRKLTRETDCAVRSRGHVRPIILELTPRTCSIRLKGTRKRYTVSYDVLHDLIAKLEADALRREKAAAKKKGRKA